MRRVGRPNRVSFRARVSLLLLGVLVVGGLAGGIAQAKPSAERGTLTLGGDADPTNTLQRAITSLGLTQLGYSVKNAILQPAVMYRAAADGDIDFLTSNWKPLQDSFYKPVASKLVRGARPLVAGGAIQGYFIDTKTAQQRRITNIAQLRDPSIAELFDANGNGKADLCCTEPGWGAEKVIDLHIPRYGLSDTVENIKGSYQALITATISRFRQGKPILFYTWTPNWVLAVFGTKVTQLTVPFSACPDRPAAQCKTKLPNGKNVGWEVNQIYAVMNKESARRNPAAWTFLQCLSIPLADVNASILKQYRGDKNVARMARQWTASHPQFKACVQKAGRA